MRSFYGTEEFGMLFKKEVDSNENIRSHEILQATTKHDQQQYETDLSW